MLKFCCGAYIACYQLRKPGSVPNHSMKQLSLFLYSAWNARRHHCFSAPVKNGLRSRDLFRFSENLKQHTRGPSLVEITQNSFWILGRNNIYTLKNVNVIMYRASQCIWAHLRDIDMSGELTCVNQSKCNAFLVLRLVFMTFISKFRHPFHPKEPWKGS